MGKSKLEFYAKITTSDGREIMKRVEEEIPDDPNLDDLDEFMSYLHVFAVLRPQRYK